MFRKLQKDGLLKIGYIVKTYSSKTNNFYWYIVLSDDTLLCISDMNICNIDGLDKNCPQIDENIIRIYKSEQPTINTRIHIDDNLECVYKKN